VDGDRAHAGRLGPRRQFGRGYGGRVPPEPHLQSHRPVGGVDGGADQPLREIKVAHQRRSRRAARDLLGRTAHVEVDHVGPGPGGHARALSHPARLAPDKLDDHQRQPLPDRRPATYVGATTREQLRSHHLSRDVRSAQARRRAAEG
jgi:hypothetical protein